jgi:SAM-dependent methyltransferase
MNAETVAVLDEINRSFYRLHAHSFSLSRGSPWPGWIRLLPLLQPALAGPDARILDLGCGNGRFLRWLHENCEEPVAAFGVDRSLPLLAHAVGSGSRLAAADPLAPQDLGCFRSESFDVIVVMGVLHHVPSRERRRALLEQIVRLLRPDGLAVVTCWQFGDRPRFLRRAIAWLDYNRQSARPVDVEQLEPGDTLLPWGDAEGDTESLRYCHHTPPEEMTELVNLAALEQVASFRADGATGDLNHYVVARRAS